MTAWKEGLRVQQTRRRFPSTICVMKLHFERLAPNWPREQRGRKSKEQKKRRGTARRSRKFLEYERRAADWALEHTNECIWTVGWMHGRRMVDGREFTAHLLPAASRALSPSWRPAVAFETSNKTPVRPAHFTPACVVQMPSPSVHHSAQWRVRFHFGGKSIFVPLHRRVE